MKSKYNQYSHLFILSSTGTYISTSMGFGANYKIVNGREIFCRPHRFKDQPGFSERLGKIIKIRAITQEERILQGYASWAMRAA